MRERYAKSLSNQTVSELEELLSRHEYERENHTVSILEMNLADLKEGNRWIGENKIVEEKQENNTKKYSNDGNDEIVGMSLQEKQEDLEQQGLKSDDQPKKYLKELKREIKKIALKQVKNSKVFQQKQRIEKHNKKKSRQRLQRAQKSNKNKKRIKKKIK